MNKESRYLIIFTILGLVCGFSLAILIQQPSLSTQEAIAAPLNSGTIQSGSSIQADVMTQTLPINIAPSSSEAPAATLANRSFTYQGVLRENGILVNNSCNIKFSMWDASTSGVQIGSTQTFTSTVSSGMFTVLLNGGGAFTSPAFDGRATWLALSARCPSGSGTYTDITPRQAIRSAPLASGLVPHAEIKAGDSFSGYPVLKLTALPWSPTNPGGYANPNGLWVTTDESPAISATWIKVGVWADSVDGIGVRGTTGTGVAIQGDAKNSLGHAGIFSGTVEIAGNESIIGNVDIQGILTSNMNAWQLINSYGPLPITSSSFTTKGGTLIIFVSGSGYKNATGVMGMGVKLDGNSIGASSLYANEASEHNAFPAKQLVLTGISSGAHTITLDILPNTITDSYDNFQVTVIEMPY